MADWKYNLESEGKKLKGLINKEETMENIVTIYNRIIVFLEKWRMILDESDIEDWDYDIETMIEDLRDARPDLEDNSLNYYDEEENLNYYLRDFYDMCDAARVWIGV